jgi:toxin secretion/phage lysis holin
MDLSFPLLGITDAMAWAIIACICLMLFDVISGFIAAIKNREVSSTKMREGLFHKCSLVMCIVLAWCIEMFVMHVPDLGFNVPLVIPACVLIFAMEVVSILENIIKINPDLENEDIVKLFTNAKN